MCNYMCVRACVLMRLCLCVCVCASVCVHICLCVHAYACVRGRAPMRACVPYACAKPYTDLCDGVVVGVQLDLQLLSALLVSPQVSPGGVGNVREREQLFHIRAVGKCDAEARWWHTTDFSMTAPLTPPELHSPLGCFPVSTEKTRNIGNEILPKIKRSTSVHTCTVAVIARPKQPSRL